MRATHSRGEERRERGQKEMGGSWEGRKGGRSEDGMKGMSEGGKGERSKEKQR